MTKSQRWRGRADGVEDLGRLGHTPLLRQVRRRDEMKQLPRQEAEQDALPRLLRPGGEVDGPTTELAEIIRLTRLLVPPQVEAILPAKLDGGSGRCLPSSRLGMEVLRYFGVEAEPLPTRALAVNAAWQEWQHGEAQGEGEMPDPAWSVMVGFPHDEGRGVDMHLVLLVEG